MMRKGQESSGLERMSCRYVSLHRVSMVAM